MNSIAAEGSVSFLHGLAMERHIIHLHIPAFPIALEQADRPELRGRPVAVAPVHSERALILSASAEARREGVLKGMPLGRALKFCPGLRVLPPDPARTEKGCRLLGDLAARYTPLWEPFRPGHIYLDVTGTRRLWGPAKDAAARLRKEAMEGLRLSGAVGVAGNKLVSGIASRIYASPGVFDVDHGREASFLGPLGVDVLPGIGPVRKRMLLEELNITRIRQIAAMDAGNLKLLFGAKAYVIHQRARGIDPTPVYPPRRKPLIREETTLPRDENDDQKLLATLYSLAERCSRRLRDRGLVPRRAGILIRYADHEESGRRLRLGMGSAWVFHLYPPLEEAFLKACARRVRVRFIRIWFQDFVSGAVQLGLFSNPSPAGERQTVAARAMDRIRDRYGERAIRFGKAT